MKVKVIIHKSDRNYYCYDIFYKLSLLDKIRERELTLKNLEHDLEYDMECCPVVQMVLKSRKGWRYFASGDTFHTEESLKEMGLKSEDDLEGLKNFFRRRCGDNRGDVDGLD